MQTPELETSSFPAPGDAERLRRLFLADHLAAIRGALALVDRALRENRTHRLATLLGTLRASLRDDREQLELIVRAVKAKGSLVKNTSARLGERAGRLKPHGRLGSYSPLTRVAELEELLMYTAQRAAMWRILERHALIEPRLGVVDLPARAQLAEDQLRQLERELVVASTEAF